MDGLLSEKEQIEALRTWWSENGLYIVAGIVLGVGLLVGWNWWKGQQEQAAGEASALYESLAEDVADLAAAAAEEKAAQMQAEYADTIYAEQARLAMARLYMDLGRDQDAADELSALVSDEDANDELRLIARLRLAKILLYQEKAEDVLTLLQGYGDTAFAARYAEVLGDAYTELGRYAEAREAYTAALAENPQARTVDAVLVRMKINDLPPAAAEEPAAGEAPPTDVPEATPAPGTAEEPATEPDE